MRTKEEIKALYGKLNDESINKANHIDFIASRYAGLISYLKRKLKAEEYAYAVKWIYELIQDYHTQCLLESDSFTTAYNLYDAGEMEFATSDTRIDTIKSMLFPVTRAVYTLGEIVCSIEKDYNPKYHFSPDEEIEHNLSVLDDNEEEEEDDEE